MYSLIGFYDPSDPNYDLQDRSQNNENSGISDLMNKGQLITFTQRTGMINVNRHTSSNPFDYPGDFFDNGIATIMKLGLENQAKVDSSFPTYHP
jgi:hypothetical protein